MATINQVKQQAVADTPILFFSCVLPSGDGEYWSTHRLLFRGQRYSPRVLKHNLFDLQLLSDDAMDGVSQLSLTLANADSELSELNASIGFKGSELTAYFAFADLPTGTITTESTILFRGIAGDPDLITEDALTLSFTNKLSLQRIPLPDVRIQRTCPWNFPVSIDQRAEALNGGAWVDFPVSIGADTRRILREVWETSTPDRHIRPVIGLACNANNVECSTKMEEAT